MDAIMLDIRVLGWKPEKPTLENFGEVDALLAEFTSALQRQFGGLRPDSGFWNTLANYAETQATALDGTLSDDHRFGTTLHWLTSLDALQVALHLFGRASFTSVLTPQEDELAARFYAFIRSWRMVQQLRQALRAFESFPTQVESALIDVRVEDDGVASALDITKLIHQLLPPIEDELKVQKRAADDVPQILEKFGSTRQLALTQHYGADPFFFYAALELSKRNHPGPEDLGLVFLTDKELATTVREVAERQGGLSEVDAESLGEQSHALAETLKEIGVSQQAEVARIIGTEGYYPCQRLRPFLIPAKFEGSEKLGVLVNSSLRLWINELVRLVRSADKGEIPDKSVRQFLEGVKNEAGHYLSTLAAARLLNCGPSDIGGKSVLVDTSDEWVACHWAGSVLGKNVEKDADSNGQFCGEIDLIRIDYARRYIAIADAKRLLSEAGFDGYYGELRAFLGKEASMNPQKSVFGQLLRKLKWLESMLPEFEFKDGSDFREWKVKGCIVVDVVPYAIYAAKQNENSVLPVGSRAMALFFSNPDSGYGCTCRELERFRDFVANGSYL